ncbi:MAG: hypothetical protein Kow0063_38590 [Anaerolineae bacterium]
MRELVGHHWRALSLNLCLKDQPLPPRQVFLVYVFHLLGLLAIIRLSHQPLWLVLVPVLLIQPVVISWRQRKLRLIPESLATLFIAYIVLGLRLLIAIVARVQGLTSGSLLVPEPWGTMLNLNIATGLGAAWALMAQAGPTTEAFGRRAGWTRILGTALVTLTLVWAAVAYLAVRTQGVTGSDPYAYVQMAVDIASHGTPLHVFPLAPRVADWGLPVWPVVPVGYLPPHPETGVAATVWPPGYSVALASGYLVGGETGLYVLTPLLGLVALLVMWWLSLEVLDTWAGNWRFLAAGIAVFVLATSYEQVDRLSVPMADIPAQLFTMLVVILALRTPRGWSRLLAALAGVCLGVAFALRYTQVLIVVCVLTIWGLRFHGQQPQPRPWPRFLSALAAFGLAAWLVAVPVLYYHQIAFGGPFRVGGHAELALFGWEYVPHTWLAMVKDFLIPHEFLYLAPFALWGAVRLWRAARNTAIALLAWLLVIIFFHLPYPALRLRDLLSVFPVLAIWTGLGMADVLSQVQRIRPSVRQRAMRVIAWGLVLVALWARSQVVLWLPVHAPDFQTFGYLRAGQRAGFDTLSDLVPAEGIVAVSLNGGAVSLYTRRDIVRPAYWSADEWLAFVARALDSERRVYLLVDGVEMEEPLKVVQSRYQLNRIGWLPMPYFFPGGNAENRAVLLYEIAPE